MTKYELRTVVEGRVWLPGERGFDVARQAWHLTVEQPVAAVVEARDVEDVVALVRYARRTSSTVAVQPTGSCASGNTAGVILLRTSRFDEIRIDPARRIARIGAGVSWGQLLAAAEPHGLIGPAGNSPVVNVVGSTLGGGMSWFGRKYGLASAGVRAFDVVDAEGARARVTSDSDPELFWALRGGGGDLVIVTGMELELYPAPNLYGGQLMWSADRTGEVLAAYREIVRHAPPELSVWAERRQLPGAEGRIAIAATYLGDADEARALLRGFDAIDAPVADTRGPLTPSNLGALTSEPVDPGPGITRSELLTELDDEAVEILFAESISPLIGVQVRLLGGAFAEPHSGAHPAVAEPFSVHLHGLATSPATARTVRDTQRRIVVGLGGRIGARKPFTSLIPGESIAAAFDGPTVDRLSDLKRIRDPYTVFRANFPIHRAEMRAVFRRDCDCHRPAMPPWGW
ncbi:FAD-binding oxidoreductase [Nocardia jejuensis]|uniref:FAD-binding oxidoreductase n=1 Tax=Nocardia jejuensis TaxID=328049 RepID=UPI00083078D1|nr:FAD-binding oxidoreductase [Nocardia jejuensis]